MKALKKVLSACLFAVAAGAGLAPLGTLSDNVAWACDDALCADQ